jgi:hypothetical protein
MEPMSGQSGTLRASERVIIPGSSLSTAALTWADFTAERRGSKEDFGAIPSSLELQQDVAAGGPYPLRDRSGARL